MVVCIVLQTPMIVFAKKDITRDTVLALDFSGSMSGEPLQKMVEAAEKFCETVINSSGINRVAVVTYSTNAYVGCGFTDDYNELYSAIEYNFATGTTNIYEAFEKADNLLNSSSAEIKNFVLMTDGLPCEGEYTDDGPYTPSDYSSYDYANAVYNFAKAHNDEYYIYTLGFFHNMYNDDATKKFASRFLDDLQNSGSYEVEEVDQILFTFGEIADEITETVHSGKFKFPYHGDNEETYYYADSYFYDSSFEYNPSLATMSLCFAMSAFGSSATKDYAKKSQNARQLLEDIDFDKDSIECTESFTQKPTSDSIAAIMGNKKISDKDGNEFTLIALAVRGGGYEQEWASNFTIGSQGDHEGFDDASNKILTELNKYIKNHKDLISGKIKLWITGYSRAAATANLLAGKIDKDLSVLGSEVIIERENLFAYTFETPAGVSAGTADDLSVYGNIFNIVNSNDLVTKVAPAAMGFRRYGVDRILPSHENRYNNYSAAKEKMLDVLDGFDCSSKDEYVLDDFTYKTVDLSRLLKLKEVVIDSSEQISMGAFWDEFFSGLVNEHISRDVYNTKLQTGVREACKAFFCDESKQEEIFNSFSKKLSDNAFDLIYNILFNYNKALDNTVDYLDQSLKENGITNYNKSEIRNAVQPLLDYLLTYALNHLDYTATVFCNGNTFFFAHQPVLCLAWMQSMDPNYSQSVSEDFTNGSYRIIRINCPVNVMVCDSDGSVVSSIVDDKVNQIDGSSIKSMINSDGEKIVFLPPDEDFSIQITGNDLGSVTYSVNEFSYNLGAINRVVNYYDVPIETGKTLNAVVPAYDSKYLSFSGTDDNATSTVYSLTDMDGNPLKPDLDISGDEAKASTKTVTVKSNNEKRGTAIGSCTKQVGSYVSVNAFPKEGYVFNGWYHDKELVSTEEEYRFKVNEDIILTANFDKEDKPLSGGVIALIVVASVVLFAGLVLSIVLPIVFSEKKNKQPQVKPNGFAAPVSRPINNAPVYNSSPDDTVPLTNNPYIPVIKKPQNNGQPHPMQHAEQPVYHKIKVIYPGMDKEMMFSLTPGKTIKIGKDASWADIVIPASFTKVSRRHCEISFDEQKKKFVINDISKNGVFRAEGKRLPLGISFAAPGESLVIVDKQCKIVLR